MSNQIPKLIIKQGLSNGTNPVPGSTVNVHYTGMFSNGGVFDSSISRGVPFSFILNGRQVIPGWDIAVATMKRGEKSLFYIPSHLAYGERGAGSSIPPNTDLWFEIELL
jgi:FKBP-type peptidyl-prolyl cis-trans isomerase